MKYIMLKSFTLSLAFCSVATFASEVTQKPNHSTPSASDSLADLGIGGLPSIHCDSGEGVQAEKEIQKLALDYLSNLGNSAQNFSVREGAKLGLAQYMSRYDSKSCFKGVAALSSLCPQIQSDSRIQGSDASQTLLGDGFKMQRRQIRAHGKQTYGAWKILAPNGDIAGLAADKDGDGFVDFISLSGKFSQDKNTTTSDRKIKGLDWSVKERGTGFDKNIDIDLRAEPYVSSFGHLDSASRCFDVPGNPATLVALAAKEHNWSASDSVVTKSKILASAALGGWEGLQKGARGGTAGLNKAADSTAGALKGLFWDLPIGAHKMMSDPVKRQKFFDGIGKALATLGAAPLEAWNSCLAQNQNKFIEAKFCFDAKLSSGAIKGLGAAWNTSGKIFGAIGTQIKKCWTEEGSEFGGGEYFAECMGQMTFYAATSALGGGMAKVGVDMALKGGRAAQISGRALSITGEWVVDQVGLATIGPNKLSKLNDVVKGARDCESSEHLRQPRLAG